MILTTLANHKRIESLPPLFKQLFEFVNSHDFSLMEVGRIDIDGDNLFITNAKVDGVKQATQPIEVHQKYIDIHILIEGYETLGYKDISRIESYSKEYQAETDIAFSDEPGDNYFTMQPGDICVVFPEDAHAPIISSGKIHKLVAKIKC